MSKLTNKVRKQFYLTFFDESAQYTEKEVNGYWLIKQFNGTNGEWEVHLYSPSSYRAYKQGGALFKELEEQQSFIDNI